MAKEEDPERKGRDHGEHTHVEPGRPRVVERWVERDLDSVVNNFRKDLDRLFWDPIDDHPAGPSRRYANRPYIPKADIADEGKAYLVTMDLPGMRKKDIHLAVEGNRLVVSAEVVVVKDANEGEYVLRERGKTHYYRSLPLPKEVLPEKSKAEMEDGVLKVVLPKKDPSPPSKVHKIEIE